MNRFSSALAGLGGRNHLADDRLCELAGCEAIQPAAPAAPATSTEQAHLDACARCRGLVVGYRRTEAVLSGPWADRPDRSWVQASHGIDRVGLVRVGAARDVGPAGSPKSRRWAAVLAVGVMVVGVVAGAGLLGLRGGRFAASGPSSGTPVTPSRTGVVARLPIGRYATFSWSPDGAHLLVSDVYDETESRVYDRFGNLVSKFGPVEGWLDSSHLIGGDGYVADIHVSHSSGPKANSWVVASGHGSAAIIVGVPACTCDPMVDWYRDGQYVRAGERVEPFGWSPDGRLVLRGHQPDTTMEAEIYGWKGSVDVVDFASGRVQATAPAVRGAIAFNPSGTRLAAESDKDLEIVDIATGHAKTVSNARLLGWADNDRIYCLTTDGSVALVGATAQISDFGGVLTAGWPIASSIGPRLLVDANGAATRIVSANDKTTLLDLASAGLVAVPDLAPGAAAAQPRSTALRQSPWSPDGRMLVLETSDGTSLVLLSVDPAQTGAVGTALPTPVGSAQVLAEADRTTLPGPVGQLVADTKRNAFWFLGGETGGPIELYRYDVAQAAISRHSITGTTYDAARSRIAIGPDGRLWIGAGYGLVAYDPDADRQTSLSLPAADPDIQTDPKAGKPDPWIAGIAFDGAGNALVARNWVRSLVRIDGSLKLLPGRVDVSDGFPMTGDIAVAGGVVYVLADPASGFGFGVDATGTGKLSNTKIEASALVAVEDRVLAAGTPPKWVDGNGGAVMIQPVMAAADLVAAGPNGVAVLYDNLTGQTQWRDKDGKVSIQGAFKSGTAPRVSAIALDAQGRLWVLETVGSSNSLVRLSVGPQ